jgi:DNA polymerase III epsilon subunit-like protein
MRSFILCDLETTSKIPSCAQIIEAYLAQYDENYRLIKELDLRIRPRRWDSYAEKASKESHKITKEEAAGFTPWHIGMKTIYDWIPEGEHHFVCHAKRRGFGKQGCYDHNVLAYQFWDCSHEVYQAFMRLFPARKIISTHSLFQEQFKLPPKTKYSLENCCAFLGVDYDGEKHRAKPDAQATWNLFLKLITKVNINEFCERDYESSSETDEGEEDEGLQIRKTLQPAQGVQVLELWDTQELSLSTVE